MRFLLQVLLGARVAGWQPAGHLLLLHSLCRPPLAFFINQPFTRNLSEGLELASCPWWGGGVNRVVMPIGLVG